MLDHAPGGVFVKRGPAGRLRREADVIEHARHPGVVDLVAFHDRPEPMLAVRRVDGPTLGDAPPGRVEEIGRLVAALAATVADLHRLGVVHGAIEPDHVLVAPDSRPVLCGFGSSRRTAGPDDTPDPDGMAADVAGLGALLRALLARLPAARDATRRGRDVQAALLTIALRAENPDPAVRPSADAFAARVQAATTARATAHAQRPAPARRRLGRPSRLVAVAIVATLVVVVIRQGGRPRVARPPVAPDSGRAARASTTVPGECPTASGARQADVDGDGCPEALRLAGDVLEAGRSRWSIAGRVDEVAVGDWDCDGRVTLAFLDRATGGVYRSDDWPAADVVTVPLVTQVDGAIGLQVVPRAASRCDRLTVRRRGQVPATVPR